MRKSKDRECEALGEVNGVIEDRKCEKSKDKECEKSKNVMVVRRKKQTDEDV